MRLTCYLAKIGSLWPISCFRYTDFKFIQNKGFFKLSKILNKGQMNFIIKVSKWYKRRGFVNYQIWWISKTAGTLYFILLNFKAFPTIGRVSKKLLSPGRVLVWLILARRLSFTMQNCKIPSFWGITAPFEGLAGIWGDQLKKSKVTRIQFCYYLSLCINNLLPKNLKNFTKSQFLMI